MSSTSEDAGLPTYGTREYIEAMNSVRGTYSIAKYFVKNNARWGNIFDPVCMRPSDNNPAQFCHRYHFPTVKMILGKKYATQFNLARFNYVDILNDLGNLDTDTRSAELCRDYFQGLQRLELLGEEFRLKPDTYGLDDCVSIVVYPVKCSRFKCKGGEGARAYQYCHGTNILCLGHILAQGRLHESQDPSCTECCQLGGVYSEVALNGETLETYGTFTRFHQFDRLPQQFRDHLANREFDYVGLPPDFWTWEGELNTQGAPYFQTILGLKAEVPARPSSSCKNTFTFEENTPVELEYVYVVHGHKPTNGGQKIANFARSSYSEAIPKELLQPSLAARDIKIPNMCESLISLNHRYRVLSNSYARSDPQTEYVPIPCRMKNGFRVTDPGTEYTPPYNTAERKMQAKYGRSKVGWFPDAIRGHTHVNATYANRILAELGTVLKDAADSAERDQLWNSIPEAFRPTSMEGVLELAQNCL